MGLASIRTQLIALLDGIKTSAGFNDVYYDVPTSIEVTPAVAVILKEFNDEMISNGANSLNCVYTIRVMVEKKLSDTNDVEQTTKLLTITDSIIAELRKKSNTTLNGEVFSLLNTSSTGIQLGQIEQMNVFYVNIEVEMKEFNTIC